MIEGKLLLKILKTKGVAYLLQYTEEIEYEDLKPHLRELQTILEEFSKVFKAPQGLLPPGIVITESLLSIHNSQLMLDHIDIPSIKRMESKSKYKRCLPQVSYNPTQASLLL